MQKQTSKQKDTKQNESPLENEEKERKYKCSCCLRASPLYFLFCRTFPVCFCYNMSPKIHLASKKNKKSVSRNHLAFSFSLVTLHMPSSAKDLEAFRLKIMFLTPCFFPDLKTWCLLSASLKRNPPRGDDHFALKRSLMYFRSYCAKSWTHRGMCEEQSNATRLGRMAVLFVIYSPERAAPHTTSVFHCDPNFTK